MRQRLPRHWVSLAFSALGALAAGRGYARRDGLLEKLISLNALVLILVFVDTRGEVSIIPNIRVNKAGVLILVFGAAC